MAWGKRAKSERCCPRQVSEAVSVVMGIALDHHLNSRTMIS